MSTVRVFIGNLQKWSLQGPILKSLASKPTSKMPCPRPKTALLFDLLKMGQNHDLCFFHLNLRGNFRFLREDLFSLFENARNFAENLQVFCAKTFFYENTCALCSWFLALTNPALASRVSVRGKSVLSVSFFCL